MQQPQQHRYPLATAAVLALAAAVRASSPAMQLQGARLVPPDADSAYHLRRALSFFQEPIALPSTWDPFLGFPQGAPVPWAPGWDALLALCGALGSLGGELGRSIGIGLGPLLVGCATVWLLMHLVRSLSSTPAALLAGLLLALTPQHVAATQFARIDHNVVEGLGMLWLLAESARAKVRPWAVALGIAGACLGWVGGLLYAGLGMLALMLRGLSLRSWAPVRGMVLGTALVAPVAIAMGLAQGTPFSYALLSGFQPAALAAMSAGAAWVTALRLLPDRRRVLLLAGAVVAAALALALGAAVWTGLSQWLLTGDPWLATIPEMQPLFSHSQEPWIQPARMLTWGLYAFPLAWAWLAWCSPAWPRVWGPLLGAAGVGGLALLQNRFGWTFAPLLALTLALAAHSLAQRMGRGQGWLPALAGLTLLWPLATLKSYYLLPKARQYRVPWSFEAYHALRLTPEVDPQEPEWGVLSVWDHGHWISGVGERPEYMGHFGTYAGGEERWRWTQSMLSGPALELEQRMDRDALRYLLVEVEELQQGPLSVLRYGGSAQAELSQVSGLRAVFASSASDPRYPGLPGAWIYERVEGALLQGQAAPMAKVGLLLEIQWGGAVRPWRAYTQADAQGAWSLRVPYWTQGAGPVATAPSLQLQVGGQVVELSLSEAQVRSGAELWITQPKPPPTSLD